MKNYRIIVAFVLIVLMTSSSAFADEKIKGYIEGKQVLKTIYVPGKLLNIVVK